MALDATIGVQALAGVQVDEVLHLGGDEVDPTCWADSAEVQAWMQAQGINSTDGIYEYFVQKTNDMALALGKSPLRWEEVFRHFGTRLDNRTIIHAWLSSATMVEAANAGYRTVFSVSGDGYYLAYPRDQRTSRKIRLFRDWVLKEAASA